MTGHLMADNDEYAAVIKALEPRLKNGWRLHIFDANHTAFEPRKIFSSDALFALASKQGKPTYIMEEVHAAQMYALLDEYKKASPADREQMRRSISDIPEVYKGYTDTLFTVFDRVVAGKAHVVFPDTRGAIAEKLPFTPEEQHAFTDLLKTAGASGSDCVDVTSDAYVKSLTQEQREIFDKAREKLGKIATGGYASLSELDKAIASNVDTLKKRDGIPAGGVEIMLYGAAHYLKEKDLNEHRKGVTLAVVDSPESIRILMTQFQDRKESFTDTPDFVWYSKEKRLVELKTPEAKKEFWQGNSNALTEQERIAACYDKLRDTPSLKDVVDRLRAGQNNPNAQVPNATQAPTATPDRPGMGRY